MIEDSVPCTNDYDSKGMCKLHATRQRRHGNPFIILNNKGVDGGEVMWDDKKEQRNEKERRYRLKSLYGITLSEYDEKLASQGDVCAICKKPCHTGRRLAVDHNHESGAVRGLLCYRCNAMIQCEDSKVLRSGAEYLDRWGCV